MEAEKFEFINPGETRTRFAPSPTGTFHIGSARTALFNFLFAKKNEGVFILRIEDTDKERSFSEFEKDILENLKWLGLEWTEGPEVDGKYSPYHQSQRIDIYKKYLKKLVAENKAYYCFCSEEELEDLRQYQMARGEAPKYNGKCRDLSKEIQEKYLREKKPFVVRFKTEEKELEFEDLIREKPKFDTSLIGDFVLAKNFDSPLYNFTAVVDDFEMKISHIIRGEDHISNTPKQILIQEALNLPRPKYAHLPLILGQDRSKLSKRHGAVSVSEYKKMGYLPEALINFMAFLGWNPGTDREIYSLASLVKEFSLERVQKSGAVFNVQRLDFINKFYIAHRSLEKLTELCLPYLIESNLIEIEKTEEAKEVATTVKFKIKETKEVIGFEKLEKIISLYQTRLKVLSEISDLTDYFFKDKLEYDKELLKWKDITDDELKMSLEKSRETLSEIKEGDWIKENLEKVLISEAEEFDRGRTSAKLKDDNGQISIDRGYLLWPLRVALSGKKSSAPPFEIAEILGSSKTNQRITFALDKL